jgi:hypothetical protein
MNAQERLLTAISHEEPDICPSFFKNVTMDFIAKYEQLYEIEDDVDLNSCFNGNYTYVMAKVWNVTASCDFFACSRPDPSEQFKPIHLPDNRVVGADGRIRCDHFYVDGYWTSKEVRDQFPKMVAPDQRIFEEWGKFVQTSKDFYVMPMIYGFHEGLWLSVGVSTFSRVFRSQNVRKFYNSLLDELYEVNLDICKRILEQDPNAIISFTDDIAYKDRLMISPKQFDDLYAPYYRKLFDFIHKHGGKTMIHSDGQISQLVPNYIEIGLDVLQCLEPAANVDIFELDRLYGDKITWNGNVDVSRLLVFGPEEEVVRVSKELLERLKPGGGYWFGACTSTEGWQNPRMLKAMWDTYNKYKYYNK